MKKNCCRVAVFSLSSFLAREDETTAMRVSTSYDTLEHASDLDFRRADSCCVNLTSKLIHLDRGNSDVRILIETQAL
jgi:hypothetical protein